MRSRQFDLRGSRCHDQWVPRRRFLTVSSAKRAGSGDAPQGRLSTPQFMQPQTTSSLPGNSTARRREGHPQRRTNTPRAAVSLQPNDAVKTPTAPTATLRPSAFAGGIALLRPRPASAATAWQPVSKAMRCIVVAAAFASVPQRSCAFLGPSDGCRGGVAARHSWRTRTPCDLAGSFSASV